MNSCYILKLSIVINYEQLFNNNFDVSGFGDVLPKHPNFFLLSAVYTFLGLALVSMMITVIGEFMEKTIDKAKQRVAKARETAVAKLHEVFIQN
jgi:hypothetical protein